MNEFVTEDPDVVIVGAGPVGLMLAAELHLSGVRPLVVDSAHERAREPKAGGIVGQVVRLLDHRGLYQRITGDTEAPRPLEAYLYGGRTSRGHEALSAAVQGGRGRAVPGAARGDDRAGCPDLGINPETLRSWVRAAGASRPRGRRAEVPAEPPTPLETGNAALRKRVRELEEEREILRKAAKYFAGETRW
ncbi:FAD-dependent monooxygenase [Streptomyces sp. NPDC020731]|uniref:FAD-dependent monooxygenase n=1 Tax=Streptomyces sp. NPDC020731 TaxID=3365085 RepID=UPI0037ADC220